MTQIHSEYCSELHLQVLGEINKAIYKDTKDPEILTDLYKLAFIYDEIKERNDIIAELIGCDRKKLKASLHHKIK